MFFRFRKRDQPYPDPRDAAVSEGSHTGPEQTTDWVPASPPSTESPGVTLGDSKSPTRGKAIESARGSHN